MTKQLLAVSLTICLALLAGCAKTTLIPLAPERSDIYEYKLASKTIYVVLKTGEICEMQHFAVADDSVVVTRLLRNEGGKIVDRRTSTIAFNDIATIAVVESKSRAWLFTLLGVPLGLFLVAVFLAGLGSAIN